MARTKGPGEPAAREGRSPAGAPSLGLHSLAPAPGSKRNRKRVGRGRGSGQGRTAGRGEKGQLSRSGYSRRRGFEGGQMPLQRRLPKRGFAGPGREPFTIVNLKQLADFPAGAEITPEGLLERGLIRRIRGGVKVLGDGDLKVALHVKVHRFSRAAAEKIEKAGGRAEVLRN